DGGFAPLSTLAAPATGPTQPPSRPRPLSAAPALMPARAPPRPSVLPQRAAGEGLVGVTSNAILSPSSLSFVPFQPLRQKTGPPGNAPRSKALASFAARTSARSSSPSMYSSC